MDYLLAIWVESGAVEEACAAKDTRSPPVMTHALGSGVEVYTRGCRLNRRGNRRVWSVKKSKRKKATPPRNSSLGLKIIWARVQVFGRGEVEEESARPLYWL